MDVGVVLQRTPPAASVLDIVKGAETFGFAFIWSFEPAERREQHLPRKGASHRRCF